MSDEKVCTTCGATLVTAGHEEGVTCPRKLCPGNWVEQANQPKDEAPAPALQAVPDPMPEPVVPAPGAPAFMSVEEVRKIEAVHIVTNGVGGRQVVVNADTNTPVPYVVGMAILFPPGYGMVATIDIAVGFDKGDEKNSWKRNVIAERRKVPVRRLLASTAPSQMTVIQGADEWWLAAMGCLRSMLDFDQDPSLVQNTQAQIKEVMNGTPRNDAPNASDS